MRHVIQLETRNRRHHRIVGALVDFDNHVNVSVVCKGLAPNDALEPLLGERQSPVALRLCSQRIFVNEVIERLVLQVLHIKYLLIVTDELARYLFEGGPTAITVSLPNNSSRKVREKQANGAIGAVCNNKKWQTEERVSE